MRRVGSKYLAVFGALVVALAFSLTARSEVGMSSRPVGVVSVNIPAASQQAASIPFVPLVSTFDAILGEQLAEDTGILLWDNRLQKYEQLVRVDGKWRQPSATGDVAVVAGDAFWVVNRQATNQTLFLGGGVSTGSVAVLQPGLNLIGLPAGVPVPTGLGTDALLDVEGRGVSNMTPGEACWYVRNTNTCRALVEVYPGANDFPAEGTFPSVTEIKVQTTSASEPGNQNSQLKTSSISLSIALGGQCANIDIYYKDTTATEELVLDKGWLIAETDISVAGKTTLEWTDSSSKLQVGDSKLMASPARYYLVGNADIVDAKGLPLSRQKFVFGKGPFFVAAGSGSGLAANAVGKALATSGSAGLAAPSVAAAAPVPGRIIYVDQNIGADKLSGLSEVVQGNEGPKKTANGGLQPLGSSGDKVIIKSGNYNESLNLSGKNVNVVIQGNVKL